MKTCRPATIANMAPEYGATMGFFVDDQTLTYMRLTGRTKAEVDLVERYCKESRAVRTRTMSPLNYTTKISLDLGAVEPSLAGPSAARSRAADEDEERMGKELDAVPYGKAPVSPGQLGATKE